MDFKDDIRNRLSKLNMEIISIKKVDSGTSKNSYIINTNNGMLMLKLYDLKKRIKIQKQVNILRRINLKKEITINPLFSRVLITDKYCGYVYKYFNGKSFFSVKIPNKLIIFGEIVGEFSKLTKNIKLDDPTSFSIKNKIRESRRIIFDLIKKGDKYSEIITNLMSDGIDILKREKFEKSYRSQIIHGDLHFDNVLYNSKTKKYLIIDIDGLEKSYVIREIVVSMSYMIGKSILKNKKIIEALLNGYESKFKLTTKEKLTIPSLMILRKFSEIKWLISNNDMGKYKPKEYKRYMDYSLKQLRIIINQYDSLRSILKDG